MDAIISLTTIAQRVALLPEVLRTLIHQSVAPSRIILWISSEPYLLDSGVVCQDLPHEVREMARDESNPVEIRTTENIGPHRKLLPALAALEDDPDPPPIITADDDTLYPCRWLEALLTAYETHGCAITFRARQIPAHFDKLAPYAEWPLIPP